MSRSAKAEAALALHRFGMGPRPGSITAIETDPRGALRAVLKGLLRDHLRVDERALASAVFPDCIGVAPMADLVG
jgi:uncharacterized protein (DUF1800 family)